MKLITQKEMTYRRIKEDILNSKWPPGTKLVERQLSEKFGVSRTPIREAFNQLEKEGLVEQVPKWGVFVKELDEQEILEMYEVREALEGMAARLAAVRATKNDIKKMKEAILKMEQALGEKSKEDVETYNLADNKFHAFLVNASHNKKLMNLASMCHMHVEEIPGAIDKKFGRAEHQRSVEEHKNILDCIVSKNAVLAGELTQKHITKAKEKAETFFREI